MRKILVTVMLLALVATLAPSVGAQDDDMMMGLEGFIATFGPTPLAEGAELAGVTGWAHVEPGAGTIHINLTPNGAALPEGSVLEGWVVDAGLDGGPGVTNVSDDDEAFGVPFGEPAFDAAVEAAPYALSTGVLVEREDGTWDAQFAIPAYNFSPYDAVVITLESDGNSPDGFDPRPGTPVFIAMFADGEPLGDDMMGDDMSDDEMMDDDMADDMSDDEMMDDDMADDMSDDEMMDDDMADDMSDDEMMDDDMGMMDMGEPIEVTLAPTPLGEAAGWAEVTGTALVWVDSATIEITLKLGGAGVPDGVAVEGWVVDAGLDGGPRCEQRL